MYGVPISGLNEMLVYQVDNNGTATDVRDTNIQANSEIGVQLSYIM